MGHWGRGFLEYGVNHLLPTIVHSLGGIYLHFFFLFSISIFSLFVSYIYHPFSSHTDYLFYQTTDKVFLWISLVSYMRYVPLCSWKSIYRFPNAPSDAVNPMTKFPLNRPRIYQPPPPVTPSPTLMKTHNLHPTTTKAEVPTTQLHKHPDTFQTPHYRPESKPEP